MNDVSIHGLTCPTCASIVPVRDGDGVVRCPYCAQHSLVQGERGVRRWQVARQVSRTRALLAVKEFFLGVKKASDLRETADVREVFAVYVPYWRMSAFVAGWRLGRVPSGKNSTRPVEALTMEHMQWTDAAADVSDLGVHSVTLSGEKLEPYAPEALHREAMVFDPSESRTRAVAEAERHFTYRARRKKQLVTTFLEKYYFLRRELSLVYYPLWVARYVYRANVSGRGGWRAGTRALRQGPG